MAQELAIIITARNLANKVFGSVAKGVGNLRQNINAGFKRMAASVLSFRTILASVGAVAAGMAAALRKSFEFERYRVQFKVLLGSVEAATERIRELQEFSAGTPFQFSGIAQASRSLQIFTNGVLGGADSLKLVGDAAAAVGQPLEDVSFWVGRAYAAIQAGRPFGEASMRLLEMGVISEDVRAKMDDLQKSGADNVDVWNVLEDQLKKSKGGMEELSVTGEGLISTLKDNVSLALAGLGDEFAVLAKDKIQALIDKIKELQADGSIKKFAEDSMTVMSALAKVVGGVAKAIGVVVKSAQAAGAFLGGGVQGVRDLAAGDAEGQADQEILAANAAAWAGIEENAKKEGDLKKRIQESMAKAQAQIDEKRAQKEAKAQEKAAKKREKQLAKEAAQKEKQLAKEAKEREQIVKRIARLQDQWDGIIHNRALKRADKEIEENEAKVEKLKERRLMSPKQRRMADREDKQKERREELFQKKVQRLKDRLDRGGVVGKRGMALLEEAAAREKLENAKRDKDVAQQNLEKRREMREEQVAKDIRKMEQKLDKNLQMK
jgi:hypothetical protein